MAQTTIIDGVYALRKQIGKGGMAAVYLADVDAMRFDYTTLYAYTQVQGETHAERRKQAEELAAELRQKTLDLATMRVVLETQNIPLPRKYLTSAEFWRKYDAGEFTIQVDKQLEKFAPGWKILNCGDYMDLGLHDAWGGRQRVFVTHPLNQTTGCILRKTVEVPAGKKTFLRLVVGHHPEGDWTLIVRADGKELFNQTVGVKTATNGWLEVSIDLSAFAGKNIKLELENRANGWFFEGAYWAEIMLDSGPVKIPSTPAELHAALKKANPKYNGQGKFVVRGGKIVRAYLEKTGITDLAPLKGMGLESLLFTPKNITEGIEIIRAMKSIKQIDAKHRADGKYLTPAEFWKKYDAGEFK